MIWFRIRYLWQKFPLIISIYAYHSLRNSTQRLINNFDEFKTYNLTNKNHNIGTGSIIKILILRSIIRKIQNFRNHWHRKLYIRRTFSKGTFFFLLQRSRHHRTENGISTASTLRITTSAPEFDAIYEDYYSDYNADLLTRHSKFGCISLKVYTL